MVSIGLLGLSSAFPLTCPWHRVGEGGDTPGPSVLSPKASSFLVNPFLCLALPAPLRGRGRGAYGMKSNLLVGAPEGTISPIPSLHQPSQDAPPRKANDISPQKKVGEKKNINPNIY